MTPRNSAKNHRGDSARSTPSRSVFVARTSLHYASRIRNAAYGYGQYFFTPPRSVIGRARYLPHKKLWLPKVDLTPFPPRRDDLLVATLLDEFSAEVYHPEFRHIALTPFNWKKAITEKPDFVFMESAWRGHRGIWRGHMARKEGPSQQLRTMIRTFKEAGIPVVFWNKEDPPNYDYFIETAKEADLVFTTAEELIPTYKTTLGHDRVWLLPFAIQPLIHHPNTSGDLIGEVSFAGTYYAHKHPERKNQIDVIIGGATGFDLDIYPRKASGPQYRWPKEYERFLRPSLPYRQLLDVQKRYKVVLNVNSVTDSPSMCSRRVFELVASGVPIVSGRSDAITRFFGGEIQQVQDSHEAAIALQDRIQSAEAKKSTPALFETLSRHHSAEKRVVTIETAIFGTNSVA